MRRKSAEDGQTHCPGSTIATTLFSLITIATKFSTQCRLISLIEPGSNWRGLRGELKSRFPLGRGYRRGALATAHEASGEHPSTIASGPGDGAAGGEQSTSWRACSVAQKLAEGICRYYRQMGCRIAGLWWVASVQMLADLGIRRGRRIGSCVSCELPIFRPQLVFEAVS